MTDKTIRERGLTSTASEAVVDGFGVEVFSAETRKIELLAYFKYCSQHLLLVTTGEQSRKMLIRKTFIHKGGVGASWQNAMSTWLVSQLTTVPTDVSLGSLWQAYFTKYATVADSEGVTYAGLSVEGGYRKFLYEHLHLASNYNDQLISSDQYKYMINKVFGESITAADTVSIIAEMLRTFSDTITISESTLILTQNKVALDAINSNDSHYLSSGKVFSDTFQILDAFEVAGTGSSLYQSSMGVSDAAFIQLSKPFAGDAVTLSDSLSIEQKLTLLDSFEFSDSITLLLGAFHIQYDDISIDELVLILQIKKFDDSYTISDTSAEGFTDFNGGTFGQYYFGA